MRIVGALSGTSVDGIDVGVVDIAAAASPGASPSLRLVAYETVPFTPDDRARIIKLFSPTQSNVRDVCVENFRVGELFAAAILDVLRRHGIDAASVDVVGSHGQTIWHEIVLEGGTSVCKGTLQIGEPAVIAHRTGITTVADFRTGDVAAGGNGAPLTSTFDWLLLRPSGNSWRALQNIGGIGNVTFLPPLGAEGVPVAFDTGPGNVFIDAATSLATKGARLFDQDGELAASGSVNTTLLAEMLALPYFAAAPPKTTGRELFSKDLLDTWKSRADAIVQEETGGLTGITDADFVATITELTAMSIADSYARFSPGSIKQVVVSGGGSRNKFLMGRIKENLRRLLGYDVDVCDHEAIGINSDAKEAMLFAFLAYTSLRAEAGNVPSCTGAKSEAVLGKIVPGRNFRSLMTKLYSR